MMFYTSTDISQKKGQEVSKKLYRSINDQAKRLDDARSCARKITDLFSPNLQIQRKKFCEYCERLVFSEPVLYGKKGEELLWRKGYYDVISAAKKLKKKDYHSDELSNIQAHINAGIGFYHHFLSKLQYEFNLDTATFTDFAVLPHHHDDDKTRQQETTTTSGAGGGETKVVVEAAEAVEWAKHSVHQCLVYLGDLNRYKLDIYPNWEPVLTVRYYLQAVAYKPEYGMPHNQMGTFAMNQNQFLQAVYHYMRCLACKYAFEGTTNNLHSLFEKNAKFIEQLPAAAATSSEDKTEAETETAEADCAVEPTATRRESVKRCLARFLLLIDIWYFDKNVAKIYNLCHQIFKNLEECLSYSSTTTTTTTTKGAPAATKPSNGESGDSPVDCESSSESGGSGDSSSSSSSSSASSSSPSYLSHDAVFKIVVICLLCISKLRQTNSAQTSTAVAFTLGAYSQLIQHVTNRIQESVLNYPLNEARKSTKSIKTTTTTGVLKDLMEGKRKKRAGSKLRRRKIVKVAEEEDSEDESEASDNHNDDDDDEDDDDYSSSDDSFMSDDEDVLVVSSDEESDIIKISDESNNSGTPKESTVMPNGVKTTNSIIPNKTKEDILKKVQLMDVNDMLEIIMEEGVLHSIKIINDWLQHDQEVLKSCGSNTRSLLKQITYLLNLVNISLGNSGLIGVNMRISEIIRKENIIPLQEDVVLKGVDILAESQKNLDWSFSTKKSISVREETVIRIVKLLSFGKFLVNLEGVGIEYDTVNNIFVCKVEESGDGDDKLSLALLEEMERDNSGSKPNSHGDTNEVKPGGQLNKMKHMGQLWLAAEVRALESRVGGKSTLSPYLVLDADALIKYTFMVKNLVNSRKFIVLVPTAVVSALDDLKREQSEARDAIRWLESQFHRGNRFFRAQRPQERAPIPFIKYPKRRDKEMHVYIQIIECCHFLAEQQKGASNLVTLLIGNQNVLSNGENREFSYVGLAQSVGIAIESIGAFYGKWKKSKGKR